MAQPEIEGVLINWSSSGQVKAETENITEEYLEGCLLLLFQRFFFFLFSFGQFSEANHSCLLLVEVYFRGLKKKKKKREAPI